MTLQHDVTPVDPVDFDSVPMLLSDKQVAFVLQIGLPEVRRLAQRKIIKAVRFGGETMYSTESVRSLRRARSLRQGGVTKVKAQVSNDKSTPPRLLPSSITLATSWERSAGRGSTT